MLNKKGLEDDMTDDSDDSPISDSDSDSDSSSDVQEAETTEGAEAEADDDEEDPVMKAIRTERERLPNHPPVIKSEEDIVDISFHPHNELLGVALITGDVEIYKYSNQENKVVNTLELHEKACRDIEFSHDGNILLSASKDKAVMLADVESGKLITFYEKAHDNPIYCISVLDENLFATGDDEGVVKLWDKRVMEKSIYQIKKHEDYISDIATNDAKKFLLCSSGDGSLSTIDLQERKFVMQSEEYEEQLTCLGLFRRETKLLSGTSNGRMLLFNWNEFGLHSDIFPGPKCGVNALIPVTENIVVTACEDGVLRATHLFPHRHLGIVGEHELSAERLDISNNGTLIASASHNNDIKFWNVEYFEEQFVSNKHNKHNKRKDMGNNLPSSKRQNVADFFSDM